MRLDLSGRRNKASCVGRKRWQSEEFRGIGWMSICRQIRCNQLRCPKCKMFSFGTECESESLAYWCLRYSSERCVLIGGLWYLYHFGFCFWSDARVALSSAQERRLTQIKRRWRLQATTLSNARGNIICVFMKLIETINSHSQILIHKFSSTDSPSRTKSHPQYPTKNKDPPTTALPLSNQQEKRMFVRESNAVDWWTVGSSHAHQPVALSTPPTTHPISL